MELGNLIFGNSRGEYPVPRSWQDVFCERLAEMGFSSYGYPEEWDDNGNFAPELSERYDKYLVEIFGDDGSHRKWDTDLFVIMPYYWGDDDVISTLPNFVYRPTGFVLSWYKYALRDAYMNQPVTLAQLDEMLLQCVEHVKSKM